MPAAPVTLPALTKSSASLTPLYAYTCTVCASVALVELPAKRPARMRIAIFVVRPRAQPLICQVRALHSRWAARRNRGSTRWRCQPESRPIMYWRKDEVVRVEQRGEMVGHARRRLTLPVDGFPVPRYHCPVVDRRLQEALRCGEGEVTFGARRLSCRGRNGSDLKRKEDNNRCLSLKYIDSVDQLSGRQRSRRPQNATNCAALVCAASTMSNIVYSAYFTLHQAPICMYICIKLRPETYAISAKDRPGCVEYIYASGVLKSVLLWVAG